MKVRYTVRALQELTEAKDYLLERSPQAARRLASRVDQAVATISERPGAGRRGLVEGTFEVVLTNTRYILIYRLQGDDIEILSLFHTARDLGAKP